MANYSQYAFDSDEGDISLSMTAASSMPTISALSISRRRERNMAVPEQGEGAAGPVRSSLAATEPVFGSRLSTSPSMSDGRLSNSSAYGSATPRTSSGFASGSGQREARLLGKALWSRTPSSGTVPTLDNGRQNGSDNTNIEDAGRFVADGASPDAVQKPQTRERDHRTDLGIESSYMSSSSSSPTAGPSRYFDPETTPTRSRESPLPGPTPRRTSSNSSTHSLNRSRSLGNRLAIPSSSASASTTPSPTDGRNGARTPSMRLGWSRRPGEPRPPPMVELGVRRRMERWVKEIVVCNFDLERGPVVERRAVGRRWGPGEKENVAFSSFPDTSLFAEGSIRFSFKIRHTPPDALALAAPEPPSPLPERHSPIPTVEQALLNDSQADDTGSPSRGEGGTTPTKNGLLSPPHSSASFNSLSSATSQTTQTSLVSASTMSASQSGPIMSEGERAIEYRKWDEKGREWLYGYVWFEQRKDRGIARGYMQKSLVILSHLALPSLFFSTLDRLAPVFFEHGYSALEAGCHSIANWPDPQPGQTLELPVLSDLMTVKLPDADESPQIGRGGGTPMPGAPVLEMPILATLPPSTPLRAFATCLPALWSLWECLVLAEPVLVIAPDPRTCSEIVWWLRDLLRPIPPAGDFRPYLHIHDHDFSLLINSNKPQPGAVVGVTNPFFRNAAAHWPNVISIPGDKPKRIVTKGTSSPKPDAPEGFVSRRQRGVLKDRILLKRLEALAAEGNLDDPAGNEALRVHFQQLTERFLVPLNRYFQTLVPNSSPGSITAIDGPLQIKPWSNPNFLSHLKNHGPNPLQFRTKGLMTKSRVEHDFYASFCMSATFAGWLSKRIESQGFGVDAGRGDLPVGLKLQLPPKGRKPETQGTGLGILAAGQTLVPRGVSPKPLEHDAAGGDDGSSNADTDAVRQSSEDGSSTSHGQYNEAWRASDESVRAARFDVYGRRASEGAVKALRPLQ